MTIGVDVHPLDFHTNYGKNSVLLLGLQAKRSLEGSVMETSEFYFALLCFDFASFLI